MTGIEAAQTYAAGEVIYQKGDPATHLYLIQQGTVLVTAAGNPVSFGEGQVVGDGGMVSGAYKATMAAGPQGCTVLPMDYDTLKVEIGRSPPLVQLLVTNLLARLEVASKFLDLK